MTIDIITVSVGADGSVSAEAADGSAPREQAQLGRDPVDLKLIRHFTRWLRRRDRSWNEDELRAFGMLLHRRLFSESHSPLWGWIRNRIENQKDLPVRLMLEFPPGGANSALAQLPWEFLHTPEVAGRAGFFLAQDPRIVLSRYVPRDIAAPLLEAAPQLTILPVVADPDARLGRVESTEVLAAIAALDEDSGYRVLPALTGTTVTALTERMKADHPQVVHFVGHGRFDDGEGVGSVALHDPAGGKTWIPENELAAVLCPTPDTAPRVVVLHTCEGGVTDFDDRFAGLGPALIRRGVQFVAGMQYPVLNQVATTFSTRLYEQLAKQIPLDEAVQGCRLDLTTTHDDPRLMGLPVLHQCSSDPVLTARPMISSVVAP